MSPSSARRTVTAALGLTGAAVGALAARDLTQKKHSILRIYPVIGHMRYFLESIRPELQQYFIERNWDGRPFDREVRTVVYERAKGIHGEQAFGTERDVNATGYEYLVHSLQPVMQPPEPSRVLIGGPDCTQPYSMAVLNVSAMSFGSLSSHAIKALNIGAREGGFAHDTGEGSLTPYHEEGGDLIWELGTGYFGARTPDGLLDEEAFREKAMKDQVKAISVKLSQGAKPGIGGVLPGPKVTAEIAGIRGVPEGEKCVSPPAHTMFDTPRGLIEFIARLRQLSGGKPVGFKLCVGSKVEVLSLCKAMLEVGTAPDFIHIDGSEGGTGAAPLEFEDHMGMPLTQGLMTMHNALVGVGLRDRVKIGAAGKVAAGNDIIKRMIQGADYTLSARAMMMAVGCIQALACHTGKCPTGVATQDPRRVRGLVVEDKSVRVTQYQQGTVDSAMSLMAAMGVDDPADLRPWMLRRNLSPTENASYATLYQWLQPGELLEDPPDHWADARGAASAESFRTHHFA